MRAGKQVLAEGEFTTALSQPALAAAVPGHVRSCRHRRGSSAPWPGLLVRLLEFIPRGDRAGDPRWQAWSCWPALAADNAAAPGSPEGWSRISRAGLPS